MIVLGLDLGKKATGWCLWSEGGYCSSGVVSFDGCDEEIAGHVFMRCRDWLIRICACVGSELHIAYEQPHHRGGASTFLGVGLAATVETVCAERMAPVVSVHTATLKKWATGDYRAKKWQMIDEAEKHIGRRPVDDNEADAVHVARWGWEQFNA